MENFWLRLKGMMKDKQDEAAETEINSFGGRRNETIWRTVGGGLRTTEDRINDG